MNASVRASANGPSKDEALKYAPKKARPAEPEPTGAGEPPAEPASARPEALEPQVPEAPEPPWKRTQRASGGTAFVGDAAIAELRTKLALTPDRLPEPPPPSASGSTLMWAGRITGVAVVVAFGFIGYRWGASPHDRSMAHPLNQARQPAAADQSVMTRSQSPGATVVNAVPAVYPPPAKAGPSTGGPFRHLIVGAVPVLQADDAARLVISATDAGADAGVVISGLAPGSALSAGQAVTPTTWRLSVEELSGVAVTPPSGFAGTMDLNIELRLADGSVADRRSLQLEWLARSAAAKPQPRSHDTAEIAQMVKRGEQFMANGDVAAARLMYQRAAEAGEAAAAFKLAETFDPLVYAKDGIAPDIRLAMTWYTKAKDLGSTQAPERLDTLARLHEQ
jgi:TPR repeat protein